MGFGLGRVRILVGAGIGALVGDLLPPAACAYDVGEAFCAGGFGDAFCSGFGAVKALVNK